MPFELSVEKLIGILEKEKLSLGEYTLRSEMEESEKSREEVLSEMAQVLATMREAASQGRERPVKSVSGLTGGDAYRYQQAIDSQRTIMGQVMSDSVSMALSCSEVNASMGRIVACPTAGSCGIVPGALLAAAKKFHKSDGEILMALFTASGVGIIIGSKATLSGAEGGCQAECGSATAMAAAAICEMLGGTPSQAFDAAAVALKNVMGLVCDPVAGLVEIPCIKRNASGAVNAILCADLALAGVPSYIPFEDTVEAMYKVGQSMCGALKETAQGGLAVTPAGIRLRNRVLGIKMQTK